MQPCCKSQRCFDGSGPGSLGEPLLGRQKGPVSIPGGFSPWKQEAAGDGKDLRRLETLENSCLPEEAIPTLMGHGVDSGQGRFMSVCSRWVSGCVSVQVRWFGLSLI